MNLLKYQKLIYESIKFSTVGIVHNLISYLIYLLITYYGGEPKMTVTILTIITAFIVYFINKNYVFRVKKRDRKYIIHFLMTYFSFYLINIGTLIIFVDNLGHPHQIVLLISMIICSGFSFIIQKIFIFSKVNQN